MALQIKISGGKAANLTELSDDQMDEIREAFALYDRDHDGHITAKDVAAVLHSSGQYPSEDEVQALIKDIDVDGDGTIDFSEFLAMVIRNMGSDRSVDDADVIKAFKIFDRDGNGFISATELRFIMNNFGEKMTDEQAGEMLQESDLNGDGHIDIEEFTKMIFSNLK